MKAFTRAMVLVVLSIVALFVFWWNDPPPSISYVRIAVTPVVEPGERFIVKNRVHRNKSCYTKLLRRMIDGAGKVTEYERDWAKRQIGWEDVDTDVRVPEDATPGKAQWKATVIWFCNPLQKYWPQEQEQEAIEFFIVPKGAKQRSAQ